MIQPLTLPRDVLKHHGQVNRDIGPVCPTDMSN